MKPSTIDNECDIQAQGLDRHTAYEIFSPTQKQPTDLLGALCNNAFQQALIKFSVASWEDNANTNIIQDFQIYATCGSQCFSFKTKDEKVRKVEETSLKYLHEKVDSWILFHAKFINAPNTLVIRTVDTIYFSYYSLQHAKTFLRVESMAGSWFTLK